MSTLIYVSKKAVDLKLHVVKYISTYINLKLKNHLNKKEKLLHQNFIMFVLKDLFLNNKIQT